MVPGNDESGVGRTIMGWLSLLPPDAAGSPDTLSFAAASVAPVLVAVYVGATTFLGGTSVPWRPLMVDLDVYRLAGRVLEGGDLYNLPGRLPFLYPPFAALLAVPLAVLPEMPGAGAVDRRWGGRAGRRAAPLRADRLGAQPGGDGHHVRRPARGADPRLRPALGIFLVALVALDLTPGPRVLPCRLLPEGCRPGWPPQSS